MSYRLPPLNALRAFEAAARHLSFKNAALELSVTPTAVSHQIKLLEEFLDLPLFHRLTRALELTPQGEAMLPKVREGLGCFAAAVESAHERVSQGRPGHPHPQDPGGDPFHQLRRQAQWLGIQRGVALGLAPKRVQSGGEVPVGPVRLEQRGRRLHGLKQFLGRLGGGGWRGRCR